MHLLHFLLKARLTTCLQFAVETSGHVDRYHFFTHVRQHCTCEDSNCYLYSVSALLISVWLNFEEVVDWEVSRQGQERAINDE